MQHVKKEWIQRLIYSIAGINVAMMLGYAYMQLWPPSEKTQIFWGITEPVLVFCVVNIIYLLVVFPKISKGNLWISTVIACAMLGILSALLIETSQQSNSIYRLMTTVMLFASAMTGPFVPIAGLTMVWLLYIFTLLSVVDPSRTSVTFYTAWNVFHTVMAYLGWLIIRKYYVRDDTRDLKKVSGLLEEEQVKASMILESITDGVIVISPQGAVQLLNKSATEMLGWSKDEATGLDYKNLLIPQAEGNTSQPDSLKTAIDLSLQTGKSSQKVNLFKTRSKDSVYFDIVASPVLLNNAVTTAQPEQFDGIIAVIRDVSAARAEEQRRADFISTASHEMRTPVAAIEGYLALALNPKLSQIDEKAKGYLSKAHENTQHLGELFQDLLTTTKAEDGRLVNHPEVVEMGEYLDKLTGDLRFAAEKKGLKTSFATATGTEAGSKVIKPLYYTYVDPLRIHEVITNLFDNAVKYTESGSITLGLTGDQNTVQCSIKDTGHGIPSEDAKHLFQKFYRVDNSVTRTVGGTGLGLFICRKIVEMYGGRIWVESELGQGSTFYINLPRLSEQQVAQYQAAATAQQTAQPDAKQTVYAPEAQSTG